MSRGSTGVRDWGQRRSVLINRWYAKTYVHPYRLQYVHPCCGHWSSLWQYIHPSSPSISSCAHPDLLPPPVVHPSACKQRSRQKQNHTDVHIRPTAEQNLTGKRNVQNQKPPKKIKNQRRPPVVPQRPHPPPLRFAFHPLHRSPPPHILSVISKSNAQKPRHSSFVVRASDSESQR